MKTKTRIRTRTRTGRRLLSLLLAAAMLLATWGIPVWAETADDNISLESAGAEAPANPAHHCTKDYDGDDDDSDYTDWSYIYFGSYPQSEVTDTATIAAIDRAIVEGDGTVGADHIGTDIWVDGIKYRRINKDDTNYNGHFDEKPTNNGYRYFKWERIKWRVLDSNDKGILFVAADSVLDCKDYHDDGGNITWENSTIRNWLNSSFYNTAFSSSEQEAITAQNVVNENNLEYGTEGGNDTIDKVYLLSIGEVTNIACGFCSDGSIYSASRRLQISSYANARGAMRVGSNGGWWGYWWLRSPGNGSTYAAYVSDIGYVYARVNNNYDCGVAPALHISLSSALWSIVDDDGSGEGGNHEAGRIYTVAFNSQGGSAVAGQPVVKGEYASKPANPTRNGYTFAGWYIDAACKEPYNFDEKVTGSITLYAKWTEEEPPFTGDLSSLTYSFSNSNSAFGYSATYKIPLSSYQMVFGDIQAKSLYNNVGGIWGGSCYGMSSTSGMLNVKNSGMTVADFSDSADKVSNLKVSDVNHKLDATLRTWIEAMHVSQFDASIQSCYVYNTDLDSLCAEVNSGLPAIIAVFGPEGGHALVGYKVEKISDTQSDLYVYDCNYPKQERKITLTTDASGSCTGWYYYLNNRYHWGSDYSGCRIAYVPYECYQGMWADSPAANQYMAPSAYREAVLSGVAENISDGQNMLMVNSDEFKIQDQSGKVVAEVNDGQLITEKQEIYQFRPTDLMLDGEKKDAGEKVLIYLPTDAYMIKNTDESIEKLEVSMVNEQQSIDVTTTADDVTVHVDDSEKCNTASICANESDSYEVVLNSSLENAKDMEEITVSGIAAKTTVEVGMTEEGCVLKNCTDISMKINGMEIGSVTGSNLTDISKMEVSLEYTSCVYDGTNKEPGVTLKDGSSLLKSGTDYIVVYSNNIEPGMAAATVYGIGKYAGTVAKYFTINKEGAGDTEGTVTKPNTGTENPAVQKSPQKLSASKTTYDKAYGNKAFTLDVKRESGDGTLLYTSSDNKVAEVDANGKVTIKGTGIATITVHADASANYNASPEIKVTIKVSPAKQTVKSLKTAKGRKLTVSWKKDTKATGYEIQCSTDSKFKKDVKKITVKSNKTTSRKITKLKAGKKYYVKVRAYKTAKVNGKSQTLCGAWSKAKKSGGIKK